MMTDRLTLRRPDDLHLHVRDGAALAAVVPFTARQFARALIMPNLKPPVTTVETALAYRERIRAAVPEDCDLTPLMTLYLTDATSVATVRAAKAAGIVAFKLYPAGATTNSDAGVTDIFKLLPVLEAMAQEGLLLLVHGEVTDAAVDVFDREAVFIERVLAPLLQQVPGLKIVFEHITTAEAAQLVCEAGDNLAASVTPQHLLMNRNALFSGGVRPHHYCLPVLKRESHRQSLLNAVTGPYAAKFFLGTDSAPHAHHAKESCCGCAGIFSAATALELYAEAFDSVNALPLLEAFASENGARFYGLPLNTGSVTLVRKPQTVPEYFAYDDARLVPLRAGGSVAWTLEAP